MQGGYILDVNALSWTGTGYDSNDDCCDGLTWNWWQQLCDKSCDNKFTFCMRPYGYDTDSEQCPMGFYESGDVGSNSITFDVPLDDDVPNPMNFTGALWEVTETCIYIFCFKI